MTLDAILEDTVLADGGSAGFSEPQKRGYLLGCDASREFRFLLFLSGCMCSDGSVGLSSLLQHFSVKQLRMQLVPGTEGPADTPSASPATKTLHRRVI